jgi:hypothetical protein
MIFAPAFDHDLAWGCVAGALDTPRGLTNIFFSSHTSTPKVRTANWMVLWPRARYGWERRLPIGRLPRD